MTDKKLLFIFGTRPEAIKLAPVIRKWNNKVVFNTGQHNSLMDLLDIKPDRNLHMLNENSSIVSDIGFLVKQLDMLVPYVNPDAIVVQGDTTSALCGAIVAFYSKIKLIHVEAGLRTYDNNEPYPEEANRRIIDTLSDIKFAPTEDDLSNLYEDGLDESTYVVGNTVVDSLLDITKDMNENTDNIILVTVHRRENIPQKDNIFKALNTLAKRFPHFVFIYPIHPSYTFISETYVEENIKLIEPLPYLEFIKLMKMSYLIMSDSGGIQEEAPTLHKPVIVLRKRTERLDLIRNNGGFLVGTNTDRIIEKTSELITNKELYNKMSSIENPFGEGHASDKIVEILRRIL